MRGGESVEPESLRARAAAAAVAWAQAEGWNPGLDDEQRFLAADPDAFLATERADEVAATVSCALYGQSYAFIGFYIVRHDLRRQGVGSPLLERALSRARGRVVGLDAVLEQQTYYERRGFVVARNNARWSIAGGGGRPTGLVELAEVPFERLLAYDAAVFGVARERFLRVWVDRPPGHTLACLADGNLLGYGVLRPCRVGAKVGPLFADDEEVADALLSGLLATARPGTEVFVDMPDSNPATRRLRARRQMHRSFETARMYLHGSPDEDPQRTFGVTTLELG